MSEMADAIRDTLLSEVQTALGTKYPARDIAGYFGDRFVEGDPPAWVGQWYCAVHNINSREENRNSGNLYVTEKWQASITITVRSSYAPDDKIDDPKALLNSLLRLAATRLRERPWEIQVAINAAFQADHGSTNGLTCPFQVDVPMPVHQVKAPAWLKAIAKKPTFQKNALSGTIRLSNALHIQALGNLA